MFKYYKIFFSLFISMSFFSASAQDVKIIKLPAPQKEIGKPLMEVLNLRHSSREFDSAPLEQQELSNLLWAAFGINRTESGKRTAPSARDWQETEIYVATAEGVFIYQAKEHSLKQILSEDIRALAGTQEYVKTAAVNLIYVSDQSKMKNASDADKWLYSGADVAFIAENAYLYCASQNLAVVIRAMINKEVLSKKLNLNADQKIILSQSVGYPKKQK